MNALVRSMYSRYPGFVSFIVFSNSPTPDTRTSRKVMINGLKTVSAPHPVAAAIR